MADVSLRGLTKHFAKNVVAVDHIDLEIADGEFLVLVGPSGCGKSTTLRMVAGLESADAGEIRIGGRLVNQVAPKDRDIAMVFQNYALYPHLSVYRNLSFGLELRFGGGFLTRGVRRLFRPARATEIGRLRREIPLRVRRAAERLNITHLLNRKPHELSGGERQRVALGRAIVRNPAAFLFDEPLSNLDAQLRAQMRVELKRLHNELGSTMIHVTHDQVEAMTLGDRVAVMNHGSIVQVGKPIEIYKKPKNRFVARFVGTVPMNLVSGRLLYSGPTESPDPDSPSRVGFRGDRFEWNIPHSVALTEIANREITDLTLGVRAESIEISTDLTDRGLTGIGKVSVVELRGDVSIVHLDFSDQGYEKREIGTGEIGAAKMSRQNAAVIGNHPAENSRHSTRFRDGDDQVGTDRLELIARIPSGTVISEGQKVGFRFDPLEVHWFDRTTGENLLRDK